MARRARTPKEPVITSKLPLEAISIQPCATHPSGPYVCHCQVQTDVTVRALAREMLLAMLAQVGQGSPAAQRAAHEAIDRVASEQIRQIREEVRTPGPITSDDDPTGDDDDPVAPLSQEAHDGMVQAALARRAQRESISVLRRPNVTED